VVLGGIRYVSLWRFPVVDILEELVCLRLWSGRRLRLRRRRCLSLLICEIPDMIHDVPNFLPSRNSDLFYNYNQLQ
jgi:hypothetical protein